MPSPTLAALTAVICLATTTHQEARNQTPKAQRLVLCTILNNTPSNASPCTTATDRNRYTSNRHANRYETIRTSKHAPAVRIPRQDTREFMQALTMASQAVKNPNAFQCPYRYFNNAPLGKRFKTHTKAHREGDLLFY